MGESQSSADDLLLYRVIPDWCLHNSIVSSQAFRPLPKANGLLSVCDSTKINPEDCLTEYASDATRPAPEGIMGILASECTSHTLAVLPAPPPDHHVTVDFRAKSNGQKKKIGGKRRDKAVSRGWLVRQLASNKWEEEEHTHGVTWRGR